MAESSEAFLEEAQLVPKDPDQHDEHEERGTPAQPAHAGLHSHLEIVVLGLWQFTALWAAV